MCLSCLALTVIICQKPNLSCQTITGSCRCCGFMTWCCICCSTKGTARSLLFSSGWKVPSWQCDLTGVRCPDLPSWCAPLCQREVRVREGHGLHQGGTRGAAAMSCCCCHCCVCLQERATRLCVCVCVLLRTTGLDSCLMTVEYVSGDVNLLKAPGRSSAQPHALASRRNSLHTWILCSFHRLAVNQQVMWLSTRVSSSSLF